MKIISLVENTSESGLKTKHGLSLYIETDLHKILFDLGPDDTLFENAAKRNIDISKVDIVVISHGHSDHGGALKKFLEYNTSAMIYIQREAFEPHYSKIMFTKVPIGLDRRLIHDERVILLDGNYRIDDELYLFTVTETSKFYSPANSALYDKLGKDTFRHEQNLIIAENKTALIMGCGHCGVVNIMEEAAKYHPCFCIGGFHLFNPLTRKTVPEDLLDGISGELQKYGNIEFYTCHCTGNKAYEYLSGKMKNMHYMSCGDTLEI